MEEMLEYLRGLLPDGWELTDVGDLVCPDGHVIEPDGTCPDGLVSPLRRAGLI